jgi:hypothetical protein
MRGVGSAIAAGFRAPLRRLPLVLALWSARLLPILFGVALPLHAAALERSAAHPDAGLLLDGSGDRTGFVQAWTSDLFRDGFGGVEGRIAGVALVAWLLVTFFAGGVTARLLGGEGLYGSFLGKCGRYAGRLFRLGLLLLLLVYTADAAVNVCLLDAHQKARLSQHTEDLRLRQEWLRGALTVGIGALLGLLHAYARIDIVRNDRKSALLALLRAPLTLILRLPKLVVAEGAMALLSGLLLLVALLPQKLLHERATWGGIAAFLVATALVSYLRTSIEVGAMEARCRILDPGGDEPAQR